MTGDALKTLRLQAGLTQQQVADLAGWNHRVIVSALEKRANVPPGSASRYVEALAKHAGDVKGG